MLIVKKRKSVIRTSFKGKFKLASFKEKQRPDGSDAASHVGAAVLAHVACSGRSDAALR